MYIKAQGSTITQFPYTLAQLRADNPNTSFPRNPPDELLADYSVFPVQAVSPPEHDRITQRVEAVDPVYEQGQWRQAWQVVDLSEQETQANIDAVRQRAKLTRMQFMLALDDAGLYDEVAAAVADHSTPNSTKIMWHNASEFERMHPELVSLAHSLGHTDAELDQLFGIDH